MVFLLRVKLLFQRFSYRNPCNDQTGENNYGTTQLDLHLHVTSKSTVRVVTCTNSYEYVRRSGIIPRTVLYNVEPGEEEEDTEEGECGGGMGADTRAR